MNYFSRAVLNLLGREQREANRTNGLTYSLFNSYITLSAGSALGSHFSAPAYISGSAKKEAIKKRLKTKT